MTAISVDRRESRPIAVTAEYLLDFDREKAELFTQAWTLLRDNFYDPAFHGVNWVAQRDAYAPRIAGAARRAAEHHGHHMAVAATHRGHEVEARGAGVAGLDAIDAFDMTRGVKFETYCVPRIRGAMLDELRTMDWVPRLVRSKASKMEAARKQLEAALGRPPKPEELADKLGIPLDQLDAYLGEATAVNLDIEPVEKPETVLWVDPIHRG